MTLRRVVAAVAVASLALVSCGDDASDTSSAPTTTVVREIPNLVGTWSGSYEFPSKGKVIPTALNLVVERQEGANLFGYESFVNADGETIKFELVGTVNIDPIDGEAEAVMATTGFFFDIEVVDENNLTARFVRIDDKPTTFFVQLTRQ
ncbi:MAG: hypothetical protein ACKOD2_17200 [Ilumatobacteraceae bacterium]